MSMKLGTVVSQLANPPGQVTFTACGRSMTPLIHHGQQVTVHRVTHPERLAAGDIVLAKVAGRYYLHKITAIDKAQRRVQIANNHGHVNGWTGFGKVYGIYTGPGQAQ